MALPELPPLPAENQNPWYEERQNFDLALAERTDLLEASKMVASHGVKAEPTDLDALRGPSDMGTFSVRLSNTINVPDDPLLTGASGDPLLNVRIERNATNGIVQHVTTAVGSWYRQASTINKFYAWRRSLDDRDFPVVSTNRYAPLVEGQTLYVIDPAHAGQDFPVGVPEGFSLRWGSEGATFSRDTDPALLDGTGTRYSGYGFGMLAWDEFAPFSDGDVLARVAMATLTSMVSFGVMMRASSPDSETKTGYFCFVSLTGGTPALVLASYEDDSYTRLGSAEFDVAANQPFMLRVHAEGTQIRAKAWLEGTPEPEAWMVAATSAVASSGWVGLMQGGGARGVSNYLAINASGGSA